jgi:hypothetical protein
MNRYVFLLALALVIDLFLIVSFFSPWAIPFYIMAVCVALWCEIVI